MNARTIVLVAIVALATAFLCNAIAQQAAKIPNALEDAQKPPQLLTVNAIPSRFQLTVVGDNYYVLTDTHTGHCWQRALSGAWQDLGNPAVAKN